MILIYTIIGGLFGILFYKSYFFTSDKYDEYVNYRLKDNTFCNIQKHRLYHIIFSGILAISSFSLSVLYFLCVVFTVAIPSMLWLVPTLLIIKQVFIVLVILDFMLILNHMIDEETPGHVFYTGDRRHVSRSNIIK